MRPNLADVQSRRQNGVATCLLSVVACLLLSTGCGGDDNDKVTDPPGEVIVLDSHNESAWQKTSTNPHATLIDGVFASPGINFGIWESVRIDLSPYREARLRCHIVRPRSDGGGQFSLSLYSNVPGTRDIHLLNNSMIPAECDSVYDFSLENALGFREATLHVNVMGSSNDGHNVTNSIGDLQIVGQR